MSDFRGWTMQDGLIIVYPLMGYSTAIMAEIACGLRLEFAPAPQQFDKPESVQLILTPPQARELAGALLRMADKIESTQSPDQAN